jgi:hypothetical protein
VVQLVKKFSFLYRNRKLITWDEVLTVVTVGINVFWDETVEFGYVVINF